MAQQLYWVVADRVRNDRGVEHHVTLAIESDLDQAKRLAKAALENSYYMTSVVVVRTSKEVIATYHS